MIHFPAGRVKFWSPDKDSCCTTTGQAILYSGDKCDVFRDIQIVVSYAG